MLDFLNPKLLVRVILNVKKCSSAEKKMRTYPGNMIGFVGIGFGYEESDKVIVRKGSKRAFHPWNC